MVKDAENKAHKLRLIGVVDNNGSKLGLITVSVDSVFFTLSGSGIITAYYTESYSNTPLIIRGSGVSAEVTPTGFLA